MHLHSITNIQIPTIPSKLSHLTEKMARTSRSNPDDGSRSVISRSERYQLLEKKRSIDATPPHIVTKVVKDKKLATTTNDDVTSPLSTASLATSPAIPWMEWAQMKGLFHCSSHRRQNIKKKFGGGEGNTPLTCLWMYNILVKCNSIGSIRYPKNKYLGLMKPAHAAYLESLQDDQQFPLQSKR